MNNAEYHANPAVSNSTLSRFLQSPRLTRTPLKRTPSMRWGTLVHTFLLEPHMVATDWAVMPEGLDKGKGAKERKEQFAIESEGKEVVKHEEYESLVAIRDAVFADEFAGALLSDKGNIVEFIADIFERRGAESYLGEAVEYLIDCAAGPLKAQTPPQAPRFAPTVMVDKIGRAHV